MEQDATEATLEGAPQTEADENGAKGPSAAENTVNSGQKNEQNGQEGPLAAPRRTFSKTLSFYTCMVLFFFLLAAGATWPVILDLDAVVLGNGELGGWLWRYWLMKAEITAIFQELPDDPIRAFFTIISLGRYPETGNVLDLLAISMPLEWIFGAPAYYNVKCLLLIVSNCLSAYFLLNYLTRNPMVSMVAASTFGLNSFVFYEIFTSGLRQAVMCFIPLYILAYERVLRERLWKQAPVAGLWLAMVAIFYWFNGLFVGLYTLLRLVWHMVERRHDLRLGQLIGQNLAILAVTIPIAGIFMYPYLGTSFEDPGARALPEVQWFTDFPALHQLGNLPTVPLTPEENLLASLSRVIPSSWSLDWVFNPLHQRSVPLVMFVVAVLGGLWRFKKTAFWVAVFMLFWTMTGGPYLKLFDKPGQHNFFLLADSYAVKMPYAYAFKYVPVMSRLFAPYRMGCLVVLALTVLAGLNLSALVKRGKYVVVKGLILVSFLGLYFGQYYADAQILRFSEIEGYGKDRGLPVFTSDMSVHPFYAQLGEEEGQIGVIHLPLGLQQDLLTYYQTIHQKKVFLQTGWANPGALPPLLRFAREPKGELTPHLQYLLKGDSVGGNTFVDALLGLNKPPHGFAPYRAEDLSVLHGRGYRYILLHERGCFLVRPEVGGRLYVNLHQKLSRRFGAPIEELTEFRVEEDVGNDGSHRVSGVSLGWVSSEPALIPSKRPLAYRMAVFRVDSHVGGLPEVEDLHQVAPPPGQQPPQPTDAQPKAPSGAGEFQLAPNPEAQEAPGENPPPADEDGAEDSADDRAKGGDLGQVLEGWKGGE